MKICKICKTENNNTDDICKYCGSYLGFSKFYKVLIIGLFIWPVLIYAIYLAIKDGLKIKEIREKNNINISDIILNQPKNISMPENAKILNEMIFVDIETTGLSVYHDEIIEMSAIKICNNEILDKFSTLVKPFCKVSPKATAINGITDDMLKDAKRINEVLPDFINFCNKAPLLAYNAHFDLSFICRDCKRYDLNFNPKFVDILAIAQNTLNLPNYKLETVAKHFDLLKDKQEHRALSDCYLLYDCYKLLNKRYEPRKYYLDSDVDMSKVNIRVDESSITANTEIKDSILSNKYVVVTGDFSKYDRAGILQKIVNYGGICQKSVTKQTDYLICGSNVGATKINKANEKIAKGQNLKIINESEFYKIIEE